jgi:galactose oxidase
MRRMAAQRPIIVCSLILFFPPGGGLCATCLTNHQDFEILIPPYLFNADGTLATTTRPIIQSVSPHSVIQAGNNVVVQMNTSGPHTFALIRHSAATHATNNDQRRIPLAVTSQSGSSFTLKVPDSPNVALTGVYYFFAMNGSGIPSVATIMTIVL